MKEKNEKLEELNEELEMLEKEKRDLFYLQGKTPCDSSSYNSIGKDINRIDKKMFIIQEKKYQLAGINMISSENAPLFFQGKKSDKLLGQSEMIKKHNAKIRKQRKKMGEGYY